MNKNKHNKETLLFPPKKRAMCVLLWKSPPEVIRTSSTLTKRVLKRRRTARSLKPGQTQRRQQAARYPSTSPPLHLSNLSTAPTSCEPATESRRNPHRAAWDGHISPREDFLTPPGAPPPLALPARLLALLSPLMCTCYRRFVTRRQPHHGPAHSPSRFRIYCVFFKFDRSSVASSVQLSALHPVKNDPSRSFSFYYTFIVFKTFVFVFYLWVRSFCDSFVLFFFYISATCPDSLETETLPRRFKTAK